MEFNLFPGFIRNNEWNAPAVDGHDCESRLPSLPRLRTSRICAWRGGGNASGKGTEQSIYLNKKPIERCTLHARRAFSFSTHASLGTGM